MKKLLCFSVIGVLVAMAATGCAPPTGTPKSSSSSGDLIQELEYEDTGPAHFFRSVYNDGTICYGLIARNGTAPTIDCK